jgi:flagellar biosynthesis/type III secretory pathway protein FliH
VIRERHNLEAAASEGKAEGKKKGKAEAKKKNGSETGWSTEGGLWNCLKEMS